MVSQKEVFNSISPLAFKSKTDSTQSSLLDAKTL